MAHATLLTYMAVLGCLFMLLAVVIEADTGSCRRGKRISKRLRAQRKQRAQQRQQRIRNYK